MGCGRENKGHIKDENLHWKILWSTREIHIGWEFHSPGLI